MKKVKICPQCGKCNNKMKDLCDDCGKSLADVNISSVEDGVEYVEVQREDVTSNVDAETKNFSGKQEQADPLKIVGVKKCSNCGTINSADQICCTKCYAILEEESALNDVQQEETTQIRKQKQIFELRYQNDLAFSTVLGYDPISVGRRDFLISQLSNNKFISRAHFLLESADGKIYVTDCSTNGTGLNGNTLMHNKKYLINNGDILTLDTVSLVVKIYVG